MPRYEFACEKCKRTFTLTMSIAEHDKKKVKCPKCQGTKVKQQITGFHAITKKKS